MTILLVLPQWPLPSAWQHLGVWTVHWWLPPGGTWPYLPLMLQIVVVSQLHPRLLWGSARYPYSPYQTDQSQEFLLFYNDHSNIHTWSNWVNCQYQFLLHLLSYYLPVFLWGQLPVEFIDSVSRLPIGIIFLKYCWGFSTSVSLLLLCMWVFTYEMP